MDSISLDSKWKELKAFRDKLFKQIKRREGLDPEFIKTLVNFEVEKKDFAKINLIKEIMTFYYAARWAATVLLRIELLNELGIELKIKKVEISKLIEWPESSIEQVISFINQEWNKDFSHLVI